MERLPLREEKRRLLVVRDANMTPSRRIRLGATQAAAARAVFMAGMAARGFSRAEAARAWKNAAPRAK